MTKKLLIFGALALTAVVAFLALASDDREGVADDLTLDIFNQFRVEHGKTYSSLAEVTYRLGVFKQNLAMIEAHNADPSHAYTLGINQFADLTFEEFSAYYLGEFELPEDLKNAQKWVKPATQGDEKEVDWVKSGVVHEAKNQGQCGSCWAFATVGAVEAAMAQHNKIAVPTLSEQELIDCSLNYGNHGCGGGFAYQAMKYVVDMGLNNDKDYPYKSKRGECKTDIAGKGWAKIPQFKVLSGGVDNLISALRERPSTVSFHVDTFFQFYRHGVYNPKSCKGGRNHAVLAVGFKLDDKIPNFYVKNSWGKRWGMEGFFRIALGEGDGTCSIAGEGRNCLPVFE